MTSSASLTFAGMGAEELAEMLGVPVATFADRDSAPAVLRVMAAAIEVNDDLDAVARWMRDIPVAVFGDRTPLQLVLEGHAQAVVDYLASISGGATG